jgi:hypothetical protein
VLCYADDCDSDRREAASDLRPEDFVAVMRCGRPVESLVESGCLSIIKGPLFLQPCLTNHEEEDTESESPKAARAGVLGNY